MFRVRRKHQQNAWYIAEENQASKQFHADTRGKNEIVIVKGSCTQNLVKFTLRIGGKALLMDCI